MLRVDSRGCVRIGPLYDFVQRLDEGTDARSLHHLVGQLHVAAGDESARLRWVGAMRQRFAATQAAILEWDTEAVASDLVVADPQFPAGPWSQVLQALKTGLQDAAIGEAVIYSAALALEGKPAAVQVSAAAVKSGPSGNVGFGLVRPQDAVGDAKALHQYLAAIAWHLKCADAAASRIRMFARHLSPLDLLDVLPLPTLITDGAGRAIDRNDAFGDFMEAASLRITTGRLRFDDPYLQDSWQVALSEVDTTAVRQSLIAASHEGRLWRVHLVPLRCALDPADPSERQMILAVAEQQAAPAEAMLDHVVGETSRPLTPAEQEVLNAMLQGHTAKVIANARGASVNTVRSQIMAILEKTGHHNQKALMAAFAPSGFRSSMLGSSNLSTPVPAGRTTRR